MNTRLRSLLAFLALSPFVLAGGGPIDKPVYRPTAGHAVTRHVAVEGDLELEDLRTELNGQDISEMTGQVEIAMKNSMTLTVSDRYATVGDGRPTKLVRTFEALSATTHTSSSHPMAGDKEEDVTASSDLEGTTVVFSWNEDESAYDVAFDGEEGNGNLLEGLEEDMDLRGFLPPEEVAEGDTWKIPAEVVGHALAPGGDVKLRPEEGGDPMGGMDQFSQSDLVGELEGEFEGVYGGTREENGTSVAVIKLKLEGKSARDMSDKLDEMNELAKGEIPDGVNVEISAMDTEYEFDAEGELLWNLQAGMLHSLSLSGEVRMIVDMSMSISQGDQPQSIENSMTFAGTQTLTFTVGE